MHHGRLGKQVHKHAHHSHSLAAGPWAWQQSGGPLHFHFACRHHTLPGPPHPRPPLAPPSHGPHGAPGLGMPHHLGAQTRQPVPPVLQPGLLQVGPHLQGAHWLCGAPSPAGLARHQCPPPEAFKAHWQCTCVCPQAPHGCAGRPWGPGAQSGIVATFGCATRLANGLAVGLWVGPAAFEALCACMRATHGAWPWPAAPAITHVGCHGGMPTFNCGHACGWGLHPGTHGTQRASAPPLGTFWHICWPCVCPQGGHVLCCHQCGKCPKWHFPHCMAVAAAALCAPPWPPTPHPKVLLVPMKGHGVHIGHPKPTPSLGHHHHPQYALTTNHKGGGCPLQTACPSGCPEASTTATPGTHPCLLTKRCHMGVGEESAQVGSSPILYYPPISCPPSARWRLGGKPAMLAPLAVSPMGMPPTLRCSSTASGSTTPHRGPSSGSWVAPHILATTLSGQV